MNQSEKHNFEDEWKQFFESASETPPPSVWDGIAERLDQKEAPIVPLVWWKNPRTAYAAAAAVALLLLSWPIRQLISPDGDGIAIQTPLSTGQSATSATQSSQNQTTETLAQASTPAPSMDEIAVLPFGETASRSRTTSPSSRDIQAGDAVNQPGESTDPIEIASASLPAFAGKSAGNDEIPPTVILTREQSTLENNQALAKTPASALTEADADGLVLTALTPLGTSEQSVYFQKRYVFYKPDLTEQAIPEPPRTTEYWAGVGIMPSSFNPQVNVTSPPAAFSQANAPRQSLSNTSKAGLSYALQMQTGMKVSKHWSIETGVSYLQGNSTFISDGYVLDAVTSRSANVLENALLSGGQPRNSADFTTSLSPDPNKIAAMYIDLDQSTNNDYRYLQLPVQAGYTLNPEGKVSYTVLGGMVANLFLQNELQSGSGYRFTNTPDDGLYRSLNWSAATGVRFNYHISDHFSASLTGAYQKALSSSLRNNSDMESRPQLYGLTWGVRYNF